MKALKKPSYIMKDTGREHPLWAALLLFGGLFFLASFMETVVLLILYSVFPETEGTTLWPDLFATVGSVGGVLLFARLLEHRSLPSLSLRLSKGTSFWAEYGGGLLFGAILFSFGVLLCLISHSVTLRPAEEPVPVKLLLLFFFGYLVQGFNEELLCRGYLLGSLMRTVSLFWAVVLSSLLFAALHLFNTGITFPAFLNLTLYGIAMALLVLKRGSVWAAAGLHSAWNFAQGNFFGVSVSGTAVGPSVFYATLPSESAFMNGGSFGLEGGLAVTLTLGLCIVYLLYFTEQKEK